MQRDIPENRDLLVVLAMMVVSGRTPSVYLSNACRGVLSPTTLQTCLRHLEGSGYIESRFVERDDSGFENGGGRIYEITHKGRRFIRENEFRS